MPELPEVETVRRGLEELLIHKPQIARIELIRGDLRVRVSPEDLAVLVNQPIIGVRRRAKYLLLDTPQHILLSHLGMTGSWRMLTAGAEKKHDHCYLHLSDGQKLAFHDPRRFGLILAIHRSEIAEHQAIRNLGPEPLDNSTFHGDWIYQQTRRRKQPVKSWIMDQRNVVGVGNIYASEALFLAKVRPKRLALKLTQMECTRLAKAIKSVLTKAIRYGGTTFSDYRQAGGESGNFQQRLMVYDRAGRPCRICKAKIRRLTLGGRSTYWCGDCQS